MAEVVFKHRESRPLRCLVVDDESVASQGIVYYTEKIDFLEVITTCSSALEAAEVLKAEDVDLMFLDINMPHLSGLEFLESLDRAPLTILTTAYGEYALDGYRFSVVDYLLKPIAFNRFFQACTKAQEIFRSRIVAQRAERETASDMYVRQNDTFVRIVWEDILYVEGMQNYLKLYFREKVLVIHQTMTSLEEMLPKEFFFKIHRSFLVNVAHVDSITGGRLSVGGKDLPIAQKRKDELLKTVVYKNLISK